MGDINARHLDALGPVLESMESEGARVKELESVTHRDGGLVVSTRFYFPTDYKPLEEESDE